MSDALPRGAVGPYQLQAAIAAVHDEAAHVSATDWPQILALYSVLERLADNPMVTLNRVIALAMVYGAEAGLAALAPLDAVGKLGGHHRLHSVRGHLLEMAGARMLLRIPRRRRQDCQRARAALPPDAGGGVARPGLSSDGAGPAMVRARPSGPSTRRSRSDGDPWRARWRAGTPRS